MVIGSFVAWFSISDFGIAQMAIAQLAGCIGKGDTPGARRVIALAFRAYGLISLILTFIFVSIALSHSASRFFAHSPTPGMAGQLDLCVAIVGLTFAVNLFLNVSQIVNMATLRAEINYVSSTLGPLIGFSILALAKYRSVPIDLIHYSLIMTLPGTGVLFLVFCYTLFIRYRYLIPTFSTGSLRESLGFIRSSWPIVVSQICDLVIFYLPPVLIAKVWGARDVLSYSLPASMFMQGVNICYGWGQPHTAAYAQAAQQDNFEWISSRHRHLLLRTVGAFACLSLVFAAVGRPVIRIYTGGHVQVPFLMLLSMAVLYSLIIASQQNYFLLLALRKERVRAFVQTGNAAALATGLGVAVLTHQMVWIPVLATFGFALDWMVSSRTTASTIRHRSAAAIALTA
jgi:O-antigen/teichoic acid export membrane protein